MSEKENLESNKPFKIEFSEMSKEQEQKMIKLLRDQPVQLVEFKPIVIETIISEEIRFVKTDQLGVCYYECPSCLSVKIRERSNYCIDCGTKFKWVE